MSIVNRSLRLIMVLFVLSLLASCGGQPDVKKTVAKGETFTLSNILTGERRPMSLNIDPNNGILYVEEQIVLGTLASHAKLNRSQTVHFEIQHDKGYIVIDQTGNLFQLVPNGTMFDLEQATPSDWVILADN